MKIYTGKGDKLKTDTIGERVFKDDLIIILNGTIDELQANIMVAYNFSQNEDVRNTLIGICKELFKVGYDISTKKVIIDKDEVKKLEALIDKFDEKLEPLHEFILPGYKKSSSLIHLARTKARHVERLIVAYTRENSVNPEILKYINRLSDLLFVLARVEDEYNV